MLRKTLDPELSENTTLVTKTYGFNMEDPMFEDAGISSDPDPDPDHDPDLVRVVHPAFAPSGKYYHRKHIKKCTPGGLYTHEITVPVARKSGCNFGEPDVDYNGALASRLKKHLRGNKTYTDYMRANDRSHDVKFEDIKERYVIYYITHARLYVYNDQHSYHFSVKRVHGTPRGGCGLRNTTPLGADDLNPSKDDDIYVVIFATHVPCDMCCWRRCDEILLVHNITVRAKGGKKSADTTKISKTPVAAKKGKKQNACCR